MPIDDARVVAGHVVDSVAGDAVRVRAGQFDGLGDAGPARCGRLIARLLEALEPRRPRGGVQPQAVDEDNRSPGAGHGRWPSMVRIWIRYHSARQARAGASVT